MPWLSLPDYSRRTGTPESTVRALIRAGKLEGHQEHRAPGDPRMVWKVWVDDPIASATAPSSDDPPPSAVQEAPQPQPSATEPPALTTGLLAILEADRATIREKDALLTAQAERLEALAARAAAAETRATLEAARAEELAEEVRRLRGRLERPWWRIMWGWSRAP